MGCKELKGMADESENGNTNRLSIQQIERDLSDVSPTVESCAEFAKNDPDVSAFIRTASELE